MKRLSIRWRLTLWYAGALAVVLTLFCLTLFFLARQQLLARLDAALREELRELVLEVKLANSAVDFQTHVHTRFFRHDVYDFLITNRDGHVLFASSGISPSQTAVLLAAVPADQMELFNLDLTDGPPMRVACQAFEAPAGRYRIHAVTSLGPLHADLMTLQLLMLVMLPVGILLALAGGYFLSARALAPVDQIVRMAETMTISNLHRRIDVANPADELGRLAGTLNSLIARLQRAVEEIQRFTADASHELRTPLAVLRAEAESALRLPRSAAEYQQTLTTVVEEATRLGRLADQLLDLSRHDAGLTVCHRENIQLDALLRDLVDHALPLAADRRITLEAVVMEPCELAGDPLMLGQAFSNLLENAIKYTPAGGRVTIRCERRGVAIVVQISDTGIGIPREHLGRVFDRFFRVDPSRHPSTGGAGLGLAIARTSILMHGGMIDIDSVEGAGTTVTIKLTGLAIEGESLPVEQPWSSFGHLAPTNS